MAESTPKLKLPYLVTSQSQKEVTHNEALDLLDFFIQPVVVARQTTPPTSPVAGDAYIIKATATGVWAGKENQIARFLNSAWTYITPFAGLSVWSEGDVNEYVYHSSAWIVKP